MVSDEDMIRFHNGDTLDSIPVVRLPVQTRRLPWRTIAGVLGVASLVGAAVGWALGAEEQHHDKTSAPSPAVTDTPSASEASAGSTMAEPVCYYVTYKLVTGPGSCESKNEICTIGSPYYTPDLDSICGAAPIAHIFVDNTDLVTGSTCLRLRSTSWVSGTASVLPDITPLGACSAWVSYTEMETGQEIRFCEPSYPNTRITFLAEVETIGSYGETMTMCLNQVWGA